MAWIALGALVIAVASLFDDAVRQFVERIAPQGAVFRRLLKMSAHLFRWWAFVILGVVLFRLPQRRELLTGLLTALLGCIGVMHLLKAIAGRARPELGLAHDCFVPLGDQGLGFDSFPSGHATLVVLMVLLLFRYLPGRWRWALPVVVVLAAMACMGRIALQRHWFSDVVAGGVLAVLVFSVANRLLGREYFPRLGRDDDIAQ